MVNKTDWKTVEMPERTAEFVIYREFTDGEMEYIIEGHRPQEMEDKWFMYYEDDKLFIHRSWTGYCIYIISFAQKGRLDITVNRDPEQYKESSIENDKDKVNIRINWLIKKNGENAELMKRFLARRNNRDSVS